MNFKNYAKPAPSVSFPPKVVQGIPVPGAVLQQCCWVENRSCLSFITLPLLLPSLWKKCWQSQNNRASIIHWAEKTAWKLSKADYISAGRWARMPKSHSHQLSLWTEGIKCSPAYRRKPSCWQALNRSLEHAVIIYITHLMTVFCVCRGDLEQEVTLSHMGTFMYTLKTFTSKAALKIRHLYSLTSFV